MEVRMLEQSTGWKVPPDEERLAPNVGPAPLQHVADGNRKQTTPDDPVKDGSPGQKTVPQLPETEERVREKEGDDGSRE
jgi:hypothetical protein